MKRNLNIIASIILFFSSVLLLIDVAPSDFSPSYLEQREAIALLKKHKNIVIPLQNINIDFKSANNIEDQQSFETLKNFIKENSPNSEDVDWERAIGVGYSVLSMPIGKNKIEAFRPLYISLFPLNNESMIDLVPVGEMLDLNKWLNSRHQGSLTFAALALLTVGFVIQLFSSISQQSNKTK